MSNRLLFILILTVSGRLVLAKSFLCVHMFGESQFCNIADVVSTDSSIVLTTSLAPHLAIRHLMIINSTMDDIPPISSVNFVNLTYFACIKCGLKGLTAIKDSSFITWSHLSFLYISKGSYTKLQPNLLSRLSSLMFLHADHGAITEVDDAAFSNLTKLLTLYLNHNNISKITARMFAPLERLLELDLSCNHITVLEEGLFMNHTQLRLVNLTHNHINQIDGRLNNHVIDMVILRQNELTTLDTGNFIVRTLDANRNKIKELTISNTHQMSVYADGNHIENNVICKERGSPIFILSLANNSLTELGCIGTLATLHSLDLSYNDLGKLNQNSFATLTKLSTLKLISANIGKLPVGIFSYQNELSRLDISHNQFGNIAFERAAELVFPYNGLCYLDIHGNNVTEFPYNDVKTTFPDLRVIGGNNFNCTFFEQAIERLRSDHIIAEEREHVDSLDKPYMDSLVGYDDPRITTTLSSFVKRTHSDGKDLPAERTNSIGNKIYSAILVP